GLAHPHPGPTMLAKLLRSFRTGFVGIAHVLRSEANMRWHAAAAVGVVVAGAAFRLHAWEWVAVTLCVGLVLSAECMNTALERLGARLAPERPPLVQQAKDSASGAVLVLALTSVVVGGIVFIPRLRALLAEWW